MKTNSRLLYLAIGLSTLGSTAVICSAQEIVTGVVVAPVVTTGQSSNNPGATGIERINNPTNSETYESMGMRQERFSASQPTPSSQAAANATPQLATSNASAASVAKVLDVAGTTSVIQSSAYPVRHEVQQYVIARIAGGDMALETIAQQGSERLTGETRAHALRQARQSRGMLMASLVNANASTPGTWDQTKSDMASSYQRYADTVIHAENVSMGRVASTAGLNTNGVLVASAFGR